MIKRNESEIMKNWKGDMTSPLVSICTRTYNLENYISEALDSFLMQETDFSFEVVINDDCSTDKTVDIIMQYMKKFPNIIKADLLKKNIGVRRNFIKNLQRAKGKYIAPCDGDDYWTDTLNLQKHVDFLEENDEYEVTYSAMETIFEDDIKERTFNWNTEDRDSLEIQKFFLGTGICAVCFRNVNIIKEYPYEYHCAPIDDNFLGSILGAYGKGKFLENISPAIYRQHGTGDYSSKTKHEKALMYEQNYFALYLYYLRIENVFLSDYFYDKIMEYSLVVHGRSYYIKFLLKDMIRQMIRYIKVLSKRIIVKGIRLVKKKK
jgi:glycosyltransferase involved in cell wall biosynthesis